jgi:hypothetical protein
MGINKWISNFRDKLSHGNNHYGSGFELSAFEEIRDRTEEKGRFNKPSWVTRKVIDSLDTDSVMEIAVETGKKMVDNFLKRMGLQLTDEEKESFMGVADTMKPLEEHDWRHYHSTVLKVITSDSKFINNVQDLENSVGVLMDEMFMNLYKKAKATKAISVKTVENLHKLVKTAMRQKDEAMLPYVKKSLQWILFQMERLKI